MGDVMLSDAMKNMLRRLRADEQVNAETLGLKQHIHTISALRALGRRGLAVDNIAPDGFKYWTLTDEGRELADSGAVLR